MNTQAGSRTKEQPAIRRGDDFEMKKDDPQIRAGIDSWNSQQRWRQIIERRLGAIGSMVKGNQSFTSDRIADVIEQIDELRKELEAVKTRQGKIADYVRANVPKREGSGES